MPLAACLLQHIQHAAADAEIRIKADPHPGRNFVRRPKSHALDIVRQPVRIFPDNPVHLLPVLLIYFDRQIHCNPVLLQKNHGLPQIPLLIHLIRDLHRFALADPLDLRQPFRFLLNNTERIFLKPAHDPGRQCKSHAFDRTGAEIPLDGLLVLRRFLLKTFHLKLFSVSRMLCIFSGSLDIFPLRNRRKHSHAGDLPLAADQIQHCIPIICIPVNNMLYISRQLFHCKTVPFPNTIKKTLMPSRFSLHIPPVCRRSINVVIAFHLLKKLLRKRSAHLLRDLVRNQFYRAVHMEIGKAL